MKPMKVEWSKEQESAIHDGGHNILVSAGAGSGKTAVLSERIYQLVKKGNSITRFLVLTFTNAAAMEMKSRVRDKILDDNELAHLAPDIENAHIETFDAFCLFLVKKYAAVLNISPSIVVIDQTILSIQENILIEETFKEWYESKDPLFEELIVKFSIKNDIRLKGLVKDIIRLAGLQLDKEKFFKEFDNTYLKESFIKELIEEEYKNNIKTLENLLPLCGELETTELAENVEAIVEYYLSARNFDELRDLFIKEDKPKFIKVKSELKDYINETIKKVTDSSFGDSSFIISNFNEYKKYISLIVKIAQEVDGQLTDFQKEHNAYSFGDIAKMAIKLVRNKEVSEEISNLFDFILVDEYQDTSDVQEEVITRLSRNNLYMVGDVKQSIYRFRNANCNIFNDKFNAYKKKIGGVEIDLNKSFRSREQIVNAINDIFSQLMRKEINIIDYKNGHNFQFGNKGYCDNIEEGNNYSVDIATYSVEDSENAFDKEMGIITSDIIRKINSGYKVVEKQTFRPCTFKDFAIIIDRKTKFDNIKKYFSDKNIPINVIQDESLMNSQITFVTKNLINLFYCVKNEKYDKAFVHAFCSISRSFLIKESDRNIHRMITSNGYEDLELTQRIKTVVDKYYDSSLYEVLNGLYEEFDIYSKIPSIGDCSASAHKCDTFLGFASNMDSLGFGLEDMYSFFDKLSNNDYDMSFTDSSTAENAVTLINIHKSKGLEYPIIYFPFLGSRFNKTSGSSFIADQKYGIIFPMLGRNAKASFLNHMMKEKENKEDFEEKLRLFYVALTRAREKIVMIVNEKGLEKGMIDVTKSSSFVNMISAVDYHKYLANYEITNEKLKVIPEDKTKQDITIKSINIEAKEIVRKKASKERSVDVSESLLEFGTKLHYALELLDYKKKDLSYIKDYKMRKYVSNVVDSFVFKDIDNAKILHEYRYYDEVNGVNGIIDCLIIKENEVDIVDFKLKNISDTHYNEQLNIYEDYVKKITTLPIKKYLISAITGEVREVVREFN